MDLKNETHRWSADRRKAQRFRVKDGSFAYLVSGSRKVGEILDISNEGLSLKYMADDKRPAPINRAAKLAIFNGQEKFHMKGVPFNVLYDVSLNGPPSPFSAVSAIMRRLAGRFDGITPCQREQLGCFIEKFTLPA